MNGAIQIEEKKKEILSDATVPSIVNDIFAMPVVQTAIIAEDNTSQAVAQFERSEIKPKSEVNVKDEIAVEIPPQPVQCEPVPPIPQENIMFHFNMNELTKIIKEITDESIESLRSVRRNDMQNLHLEVIKQFHNQKVNLANSQYQLDEMTHKDEELDDLKKQIEELKQENNRLKTKLGEL